MDKKTSEPSPQEPATDTNFEVDVNPPALTVQVSTLSTTRVEGSPGLESQEFLQGDTGSERLEATPSAESPSKTNVTMLGDFLLVKKLGAGGMGTVYQAHQVGLDREVAIKVLSSQLSNDPKFLERFQREARVMAQLDHPHILRCFAVGEAHGFHYLAMELATAGSLENWIEELGRLSVGDALHVILAAAAGLQHAHEQNLIHRDIKPGNILITGKGIVKVADLGLVKAASEDLTLTRSGTGVGTPIYSSLEQMRDAKHVDGRSDIYALGCVLYRCLTGRPPFEGENYIELFQAKEKGKYPPARRYNEGVPRRLDLIIDRTLEKNAKDRHQTCAELIQDLESLGLANETLSFIPEVANSGPAPRTSGIRRAAAKSAPTPAVAAPVPKPKPKAPPAPEWWYVRAMNFDGVHRLNQKQVLELIQEPNFDMKAEGSRSPDSGFQPLIFYREFESIVRARASKMFLDQKATRYKNQYAAILKEEANYQQQQKSTIDLRRFTVWIAPLIGLAVLTGLGYLAYWAIKTFIFGGGN